MWWFPRPGVKPMSPGWQVDSLSLRHLGSPDTYVCVCIYIYIFNIDHFKSLLLNLLQYCFHFFSCVLTYWPWGMWDLGFLTRDWTPTPCIGKWSLSHWAAQEVPKDHFKGSSTAFRIKPDTLTLSSRPSSLWTLFSSITSHHVTTATSSVPITTSNMYNVGFNSYVASDTVTLPSRCTLVLLTADKADGNHDAERSVLWLWSSEFYGNSQEGCLDQF